PMPPSDLTVHRNTRWPQPVAHPPSSQPWAADSQKLYFNWRKPGEDEATTYVLDRSGGAPVKLSDEDAKKAPPPAGRCDKAHKRVLFVDAGDIVVIEGSGVRRQIPRTPGTESNPRWIRNDSAISFVRDGNLFVVPADAGAPAILQQI